ncbi:lysylphosphatidylglycerol synthase transmembrane domain-containing protein [Paralimibaculum aggregatum]|uniref:Lysylphosphatidylglycerol synthase transmembrane domain-containing protein n=1 Tax=Paralimibaculum aggregatum TaxID=3036245 RepID=A0ABQ6LCR0_9RHOB|nr:lysylphosphatidylglycerol synthase transmembrane domain-containing protein [Limibaculum sp. NKW23]GMG81168.1 lysylphosphatidylglycerol synthase transmembrane domain-containing protein [Limibaculum sp. NKW23]
MSARRLLTLALGLAMAAGFVWLIARETDGAALRAAFAEARAGWIGLGVLCFLAGYSARVARWRAMLALENPALTWGRCMGPFMISMAVNNVLPFRAGDALRAFAFSGRLGVGTGRVLATLVVERLLDLLTILGILGLALWLTGLDAGGLLGVGAAALVAAALAVALALLLPGVFEPLARGGAGLVARLAPGPGARLREESDRIFALLRRLARGAVMARLMLWSALAWGLEGCVFLCAALALPGMAAPEAAWLALPVGTLATLLPSTPGYVGTFDYFAAEAVQLFGEPQAVAAAFAILTHTMLYFPPLAVGGIALLLRPLPKGAAARAASQSPLP